MRPVVAEDLASREGDELAGNSTAKPCFQAAAGIQVRT